MKPKKLKIQAKQRFFRGLPVREGRGDILVQPTKGDIQIATPKDPEHCAYAMCIKRMLQTHVVYIYTSVAYIQTLDEKGNAILERYMIKDHAHAYITKFDAGEPVSPGGFILHKPLGSKTLEYKRSASRKWANTNPEKSKAAAKKAYKKQQIIKKKYSQPEMKHQLAGTFRDGTGQVRFIGTHEGKLDIHRYPDE